MAKGFCSNKGVRSIRVSTDERSFLEGEHSGKVREIGLGMSQEDLRQIFESVVYSVKSLQKRLHMITSACFENQFRCRVLNFP